MYLVGLLLWTVLVSEVSAFYTKPHNTAVVVGDSFLLKCAKHCSGNMSISWWRSGEIVALNDRVADGFDVKWTERKGESQFLSPWTKMDCAGGYRCEADDGRHKKSVTAEVVVLESRKPTCLQSTILAVEGENLEIICEMKYAGVWAPVLVWSKLSDHGSPQRYEVIQQEVPGMLGNFTIRNETDPNTVSSTARYSITWSKVHRGLNRLPFKCDARFEQPTYEVRAHQASNRPHFKFESCETEPMTVHLIPTTERIKFLPEKQVYTTGERVFCVMYVIPQAAIIRWRDDNDTYISDKGYFVVGGPGNYHYTCEVGNYVGAERHAQRRSAERKLTFSVIGTDTPQASYKLGRAIQSTKEMLSSASVVASSIGLLLLTSLFVLL